MKAVFLKNYGRSCPAGPLYWLVDDNGRRVYEDDDGYCELEDRLSRMEEDGEIPIERRGHCPVVLPGTTEHGRLVRMYGKEHVVVRDRKDEWHSLEGRLAKAFRRRYLGGIKLVSGRWTDDNHFEKSITPEASRAFDGFLYGWTAYIYSRDDDYGDSWTEVMVAYIYKDRAKVVTFVEGDC